MNTWFLNGLIEVGLLFGLLESPPPPHTKYVNKSKSLERVYDLIHVKYIYITTALTLELPDIIKCIRLIIVF